MKLYFSLSIKLMRSIIQLGCLIGIFSLSALLHSAKLENGPMISDLTFREANIWVQTKNSSDVKIYYYDNDYPTKIYSTDIHNTKESNAYATNFVLTKIEPDKTFSYQLEIDSVLSDEIYTFNSLKYFYNREPPPNISIAVLGSHYAIEQNYEPPYTILGGNYGIFKKVYEENPDLVIWAGNTAHLRNSDTDSKHGYLKRYTNARSFIHPKAFLGEILHLGIWSKQDYGNINSGSQMSLKEDAKDAFKIFWPKANSILHKDALCYSHKLSDVELFFVDSESQKDYYKFGGKLPKMLGKEQLEWLKASLLNSNATFKIIISGSPMLNPKESINNFAYAQKEKEELLDFLKTSKIEGILFLSGGSYIGELTRIVHSSYYSFFDLTIGPSTAVPINNDSDLNYFRIPGTNTAEEQYVILEINGNEGNRNLTIKVFNIAGIEIWSRKISEKELSLVD